MHADVAPWYKQGWPWFVISFPAAAVIAGSITFYLAARGWDGPVSADYYRKGLAINEQLARSTLAADLGLAARIRIGGTQAGEPVRVTVRADRALPAEAALKVRLIHPGRNQADRVAILSQVEAAADQRSALYAGYWQPAADEEKIRTPAAWQVVVETQQWRLDGELSAVQGEFDLRPHGAKH